MSKLKKTSHIKASGSKIMILPMIMLMILIMAIMPFVSAVPPVQTTIQIENLQIAYPQYQYVPVDSNFTLYIHVYNTSNYLTGASTNCFLDLYDPKGIETCRIQMLSSATDYYIPITKGNFSNYGEHSFIIQCNTTTQVGFANGIFEVNKNGVELTSGRATVNIGLLLILTIFLIGTIGIFIKSENLLARVGMFGFGYLLLIAISFISWNLAGDFLLSAQFISDMFRILFFVLIIGMFPLVIGGFAWYLIMLFKVKEIERLMGKGIGRDEAEHRQGRKFK